LRILSRSSLKFTSLSTGCIFEIIPTLGGKGAFGMTEFGMPGAAGTVPVAELVSACWADWSAPEPVINPSAECFRVGTQSVPIPAGLALRATNPIASKKMKIKIASKLDVLILTYKSDNMSIPAIQLLLTTLSKRYTTLELAGCLVINELTRTMTARYPYPTLLWKYITGAKEEEKFIMELNEACKHPGTAYGFTYYAAVRMCWLRFKEVCEPSKNGNFNTFLDNLRTTMHLRTVEERVSEFVLKTMNIISVFELVPSLIAVRNASAEASAASAASAAAAAIQQLQQPQQPKPTKRIKREPSPCDEDPN